MFNHVYMILYGFNTEDSVFSCMMDMMDMMDDDGWWWMMMDVMHVQAFACLCMCYQCCPPTLPMMCNFTWHVCLWMKACIHFTSTYFFNVGWCISAVTWCSPVLLGIPVHVDVRSTWSRHMHAIACTYLILFFKSFFIHIYSYLLICLTRFSRLSVYCNI